jgi:hypothetical protein
MQANGPTLRNWNSSPAEVCGKQQPKPGMVPWTPFSLSKPLKMKGLSNNAYCRESAVGS